MADATLSAWPRPYFEATERQTEIFFVCFGASLAGTGQLGPDW